MTKQRPTREALLIELQKVAAERGPDVTVYQFRQLTGMTPYYINTRWGNWTNLRRAAGLPVRAHAGLVYSNAELLAEYHRVAVTINDYPTHADFNRLSDRCFYTLETRFGNTQAIHDQYRDWLAAHCPGDAPKFLEGCSPGCEPSVVPGLEIIDEARLRHGLLGFGMWLLVVLTNFAIAGVMVFALPTPVGMTEGSRCSQRSGDHRMTFARSIAPEGVAQFGFTHFCDPAGVVMQATSFPGVSAARRPPATLCDPFGIKSSFVGCVATHLFESHAPPQTGVSRRTLPLVSPQSVRTRNETTYPEGVVSHSPGLSAPRATLGVRFPCDRSTPQGLRPDDSWTEPLQGSCSHDRVPPGSPLREQPGAVRHNSFGVKAAYPLSPSDRDRVIEQSALTNHTAGTAVAHRLRSLFSGSLIMALIPPVTVFDHPADLVIDVFGTFLGKKSERMIVRWRDASKPQDIPPTPIDEPTIKVAALQTTTAEPKASPPHPADRAAAELLNLWSTTEPTFTPIRPSPPARLVEQLNRVAEPALSPRSLGEWQERVVPLSRLKSVTVSGRGVTVSSDLIEALVERGIALSFLSGRGQPVAQLSAPGLGGTVQTRRSQLAAYTSPLGVQLAVEFIRGKLRNQKHLLQYTGKYLKEKDPARYERLERKITAIANIRKQLADFAADELDRVRDKLMGFEGTGARLYWEGFGIALEERVEFPGRMTRGAIDPINSALNYGYGILYGKVSGAVVNAGLELYAGFLHVDRPGKPALVLDMVEEFRAPVVDRAVLAIVNQGITLETDDHGLTAASKRLIADRVLERLSTPVPYEGKRWPLTNIIQHQARHLAVAVRGERIYRAFASRW